MFRHLEGGEATWLFSDISTIPVSELNLSYTQHRKKLILESSCVDIEYVRVDTPQNQRGLNCFCMTKMSLFVTKPAKLIEQVLTITQTTLSSFNRIPGSAFTGSYAVSTFKRWGKVKPYTVLQNVSNMYLQ